MKSNVSLLSCKMDLYITLVVTKKNPNHPEISQITEITKKYWMNLVFYFFKAKVLKKYNFVMNVIKKLSCLLQFIS